MTRDTAFLAERITMGFYPQEVSLVSFTLQLSSFTRKQLYRRLQQAYASGSLKLIKRIHVLLALAQGQSVSDVAGTRSQDQNVRSREALLEPGEAGLLPMEEAADGIDQNMIGRHGAQTTGLFQRQDALHPPVALVTGRP